MSGGAKAAVIIALMVVAVAAFNLSLWRRMRSAVQARAEWTADDFDAALAMRGVSGEVAALVRELVAPLYGEGVVPHPDDDFRRFLQIDPAEVEDMVAQAWPRLGLPDPTPAAPEQVPVLALVADLAEYLERRRAELAPAH